ncbi:c-type cytochrome [Puniceibacterium sediminis]|uniref:Cytochrome c n=1 Tax=Puniceibacterium sediminis TaxID=1608407 RepID=A0A238YT59_9RHOB|nr:cytochrome c [Puniceibacterium sediminis]SNR73854.1 Cytochrome c [Puniceibacterium sediminis]
MNRLISALTLALTGLCAAQAGAQDADPALGAQHFARHCAVCHGADAAGGGPMAPILLIQPTDLTRLTLRNDNEFPVLRVVMRIDGREPLVSHGSPMPIYGQLFDEAPGAAVKTPAGQPILTSGPVVDLVAWLKSIQVAE